MLFSQYICIHFRPPDLQVNERPVLSDDDELDVIDSISRYMADTPSFVLRPSSTDDGGAAAINVKCLTTSQPDGDESPSNDRYLNVRPLTPGPTGRPNAEHRQLR